MSSSVLQALHEAAPLNTTIATTASNQSNSKKRRPTVTCTRPNEERGIVLHEVEETARPRASQGTQVSAWVYVSDSDSGVGMTDSMHEAHTKKRLCNNFYRSSRDHMNIQRRYA